MVRHCGPCRSFGPPYTIHPTNRALSGGATHFQRFAPQILSFRRRICGLAMQINIFDFRLSVFIRGLNVFSHRNPQSPAVSDGR